ncbi:class D beta-lactamase [Sphingobacterium paludis]|jgi:beta-lactamase class D|uniref:beta-lactamase n=1 Tax=Sphingobacterium paludis TaxID=1476465 RepID=A0A4R7CRJ2_9SPHI|nr:class D beta-lactamase [Sphingobacterium paludis]TDS09757.1 beta-lactamase class D [Sphingobacterium paludis]
MLLIDAEQVETGYPTNDGKNSHVNFHYLKNKSCNLIVQAKDNYSKLMSRKISSLIYVLLCATCSFSQIKPTLSVSGCGFEGCVSIFDYNNNKWLVNEEVESFKQMVPASTFKIIHLLIALETGTIADEHTVIKWPGSIDTALYGYRPSTYRDMTVKEAFEVSAGWVFMELAKKIGREEYVEYLEACNYGNLKVSNEPDFWNFGPLAISTRNQVEFLVKIYEGNVPFSKRNLEILKRVMVMEKNYDYTLRAKTGWGWKDGKDVGWWVGYVEKHNHVYFFATRLAKDRNDKDPSFSQCRIAVTLEALRNIGAF